MLEGKIEGVKGVGTVVAKKLHHLGIYTLQDLLTYYPRRYEDYSTIIRVSQLKNGEKVTIQAVVSSIKGRYVRRGLHITEAVASDDSGSVRVVWFNQPYRANATKVGSKYFISGNFEFSSRRLAIMNPSMELISNFPVNSARIIPVYRETKGLKSSLIRKLIAGLRDQIGTLPEILPSSVIEKNKLIPRSEAVMLMHFPNLPSDIDHAKKRLGFGEIFVNALASLIVKEQNSREKSLRVEFDDKLAKQFVSRLPYKLTDAQRRAVWQIYKDMGGKTPMNRLIEGDVGSGKTVVAAMSSIMVLARDMQVTFMAPTEILARQHAKNLYEMLEPLGFGERLTLLTGSMKPAQKKLAHESIASGKAGIIVGTHALLSDKVDMHRLGLVIIDEQHRFGVEQRKILQKKAGHMPHVLSMTATPIPRSLALTVFGELDITLLDEKPAGRKEVITKIVSPNSKKQLYKEIEKKLAQGQQMFVVCPLISESESLNFLSAEEVYKDLKNSVFKSRKVALLHGKMNKNEKEEIMQNFVDGEIQILVSTTVIEVGVDVPNAAIMLIEGVERFGLAQIHQLRGRVGRGQEQGYCYLLTSDSKDPGPRIKALERTNDGFKLAELDLEIRGPGAIYGSMQSGQLDLRVANLTDSHLIASAYNSAKSFIKSKDKLSNYPELEKRVLSSQAVTSLN